MSGAAPGQTRPERTVSAKNETGAISSFCRTGEDPKVTYQRIAAKCLKAEQHVRTEELKQEFVFDLVYSDAHTDKDTASQLCGILPGPYASGKLSCLPPPTDVRADARLHTLMSEHAAINAKAKSLQGKHCLPIS